LDTLVAQAVDDPCHQTNAVPVTRDDLRALYLEVL
jgi:alcohol dehydrogenase class IV